MSRRKGKPTPFFVRIVQATLALIATVVLAFAIVSGALTVGKGESTASIATVTIEKPDAKRQVRLAETDLDFMSLKRDTSVAC